MSVIVGNASWAPRLGESVRLKGSFRDRHERREYLRSVLLAERLMEHPELLARGRRYLDRFLKDDPRQRRSYELWIGMLDRPLDEIIAALLADDSRGAALRESAPVFVVIPPEQVTALAQSLS